MIVCNKTLTETMRLWDWYITFIHSFVHSFVRSFVFLFIHSFIHKTWVPVIIDHSIVFCSPNVGLYAVKQARLYVIVIILHTTVNIQRYRSRPVTIYILSVKAYTMTGHVYISCCPLQVYKTSCFTQPISKCIPNFLVPFVTITAPGAKLV